MLMFGFEHAVPRIFCKSQILHLYVSVFHLQRFASQSAPAVSEFFGGADITTLDNLVKVASENTGKSLVSVGVWFDAGSRYETEANNGAGNLVNQLTFKGTASRSRAALEEEIASIGARLHTVFSREQTGVVAQCLPKHVPKVVEILGDIVQNLKIDVTDLERARADVLRQIDEAENDPKQLTIDNLYSSAYQGTSLALPTQGTVDNVKRLTKEDLDYYVASHFKGYRTVLAASGDVNHNELVDLANKHLSKLDCKFDGEVPVLGNARYTSSDIRVRDDSYPFGHIAVAVETGGVNSEDWLVLELIKNYVGSWDRTQLTGGNHPLTLAKYSAEGGENYIALICVHIDIPQRFSFLLCQNFVTRMSRSISHTRTQDCGAFTTYATQ